MTGVGSVKRARYPLPGFWAPQIVMSIPAPAMVWDHTIDVIPADTALMQCMCDRMALAALVALGMAIVDR